MNSTRLASPLRVFGLAPDAIRNSGRALAALLLVGSLGACDSGGDGTDSSSSGESSSSDSESGDPEPTPTQVGCADGTDLTYENFGEQFMTDYCTACHASTAMGDARFGAPADKNYDTQADIMTHAADIDAWAAAGGEITNTLMPPPEGVGLLIPSQMERENLAIWLACGSP